jgi:tyrosine-protein kinase Etk/Wzc
MNQTNQMTEKTKGPEDQIDQTDEINLLDYWRVIRNRRKVIAYIFFISVIFTTVISLLMTPIYQAKATFMPVEASPGRFSTALGALQNIPFVGGAVGGALGKSATDKLVNILNSRTVAEDVIKKLDLVKIIFKKRWDQQKGEWKTDKPPTMEDTLQVLQKEIVRVTDDRKGLISITVEYEDSKLAAAIANEYTEALYQFLSVNAISLAKRNRIFLEKRLVTTKADLQRSEEELKRYQTNKKIMALDSQAEGAVKALAELKALIIAREVQLGAMREYATKDNPDVKRAEDELREIRLQMKRLETGSKNPGSDESLGAIMTLSDAPSVSLGYARLKRDALIQQNIFELLTQQYVLAKIEEAKDELTFQVIDRAIAPEKRIKPKRALNVMLAGVVSLFLGIFIAFFLEYLNKQKFKQTR